MLNIFFCFFIIFLSSNSTVFNKQQDVELLIKLEKTQKHSHFFQFILRNKIFWKKLEVKESLNLDTKRNHFLLLTKSIIKSTPIIFFQILFLFFLWLLIKNLFFGRKKRKIIFCFLLTICLSSILISEWESNFSQLAITISNDTKIYTGPSNEYSDIGTVKPGMKGTLKSEKNGFYKIKFNQLSGWIKNENIKII